MGINSTEVSYGFGQMGSAFSDADAAFTPPTGKVIIAIAFLEDTTLTSLTPVNGTEEYFVGSTVVATAAGNGLNAQAIDSGTVFPAGFTMFGRWSSVDPSAASTTGGMVFYFGY